MKFKSLFSWKSKKNIINFLSAEFAQRVVKINKSPGDLQSKVQIVHFSLAYHLSYSYIYFFS